MTMPCRLSLLLTSLLMLMPSVAEAADAPAAAPIPPQIFTAKKVFISNTGDDCFAFERAPVECERDLFYNQFYAAMKSWGRYEVVSSPAEADLVFELSFRSLADIQYKLAILDAKTHFTLWAFIEHMEPAALTRTARKNFAEARAQIILDMKDLNARGQTQPK